MAGIAAIFILKEAWKCPDFIATLIALVGMIFVAKPSFLFGSNVADSHSLSIDGNDGGSAHAPSPHGSISSNNDTVWSSATIGVSFALLSSLFAGGAYILVRMLGVMHVPWVSE